MEEIRAKIDEILRRQVLTEQAVLELQTLFFEEIIAKWAILSDPSDFEEWYDTFNNNYHKSVVSNIVSDVDYILTANVDYFIAIGLTEEVASKVIGSIIQSLGVDANGRLKPGYFNNVLKDTSIKRTVWDYINKQSNNAELTKEVRAELRAIIKGKDGQLGIWQNLYSKSDRVGSTIFDIYQRADRIAQSKFAKELGLQAAIYTGGIIGGTRPFCAERNGKVFLVSEIKKWSSLEFQGKNKGYDPIQDLGGYRCRHFWGWLSNQTAMRLDTTLKERANGRLYRQAA